MPNLPILVFLIWSALCGLILSAAMVLRLLGSSSIPRARRWFYCFVLGPPMWLIIIGACFLAASAYAVQTEKSRRAKKAKSGAG